jgi:tetratricopeptide (TPR) repeat protein
MNTPKRNRARVLTPEGLKKLREQIRSQETDENAGTKYTLEKLGELTGLDPETVKNVLDCKGSDKRTIARCFESFGLTLAESDHMAAAQAAVAPPDPNFVGREGAIADLDTLVSRNAKVIVIQARGGVGKTTLARKYLQQSFDSFLEFPIAKETKDIASIEGLIEEKLRQLGEEPGREFLVSLDRLKRKLQAERIGILIDNLEPALDSAGRFIEAHRRYVELLRVLSDPTVQSVTLITSRERLREADVTVQHYSLRSLDVTAWEQFFQSRGIDASAPAMAALHNAYGGNAKAMDIISGAVLEDFAGDVEAYWQANQADLFIERDLEDLVIKQFERLQQLDSDAYNLLCRMGCYRYQDVPTVPVEGLFCLLWDVPENRHRRVIKSLQDRSLVDFKKDQFWLHPVVREEAIARLRINKDWEATNRIAAKFWTESSKNDATVESAMIEIEAFYHYLAINYLEEACNILIEERSNKYLHSATLLGRFFRFGLLQQMINIINLIKDRISSGVSLSVLYNALGILCIGIGDIQKAIRYHQESGRIANEVGIKTLEIASLINIGTCKIYLWELKDAEDLFESILPDVEDFSQHNDDKISNKLSYLTYYTRPVLVWFYLAFLKSFSNFSDSRAMALQLIEKAYDDISVPGELESHWRKGFSFVFFGLTYKNLGQFEKAFEMYNIAIRYSEKAYYHQLGGVVLTCLAELYREQKIFEIAIEHHVKAVKILLKIGARCDLAEAYYQLGITYQKMDETERGKVNFEEAIRLFSEMDAPKQVERVRRSMQN